MLRREKDHVSCVVACHDNCSYVGLDFWTDEDWGELYGEFYIAASRPSMRWWGRFGRLAAIWKLLRGREYVMHDICLDKPEARELRDFLEATLEPGVPGEGR